jgi:hypothetical protein
MNYPCTIVLLTAMLFGSAQPAAADTTYWSTIATACTPDNISIQNDRYKSATDNFVTPQTPKIDPVVLICGVSPNTGAPAPNAFIMTYLDATGTTTTASVQAHLIRVNRTTGGRSVITSLNSNNNSDTGVTIASTFFTHTLKFESFYYYVRIEMDRNATTQTIRAIGVALDKKDPV